jgi:hypothetical protein
MTFANICPMDLIADTDGDGIVDRSSLTSIQTNGVGLPGNKLVGLYAERIPPQITQQPTSTKQVCEDSSVSFSISATGTEPLTHQWQKNETNITGETSINYTFTAKAVDNNSKYRCIVKNIAGSVTSSEATLTVFPVAAPTSLIITSVPSGTQINLSWTDNSANEIGFKIERKLSATGTYAQIATVASNITTYSNTALPETTNYYYRVRACNAAGNSSYSNEANATTKLLTPTNLKASALTGKQIKLTWTNNSLNETGYEIYRAVSASGPWPVSPTATVVGVSATTYTNSGLVVGTTYYYRIRAYKTEGIYSSYTSAVSATAKN